MASIQGVAIYLYHDPHAVGCWPLPQPHALAHPVPLMCQSPARQQFHGTMACGFQWNLGKWALSPLADQVRQSSGQCRQISAYRRTGAFRSSCKIRAPHRPMIGIGQGCRVSRQVRTLAYSPVQQNNSPTPSGTCGNDRYEHCREVPWYGNEPRHIGTRR